MEPRWETTWHESYKTVYLPTGEWERGEDGIMYPHKGAGLFSFVGRHIWDLYASNRLPAASSSTVYRLYHTARETFVVYRKYVEGSASGSKDIWCSVSDYEKPDDIPHREEPTFAGRCWTIDRMWEPPGIPDRQYEQACQRCLEAQSEADGHRGVIEENKAEEATSPAAIVVKRKLQELCLKALGGQEGLQAIERAVKQFRKEYVNAMRQVMKKLTEMAADEMVEEEDAE